MIRCINIDWLTLFGSLLDQENVIKKIESLGFIVKENDRGTHHFSRWLTVKFKNTSENFAQICYSPFSVKSKESSGIFNPNDSTVQLCNKFCYASDGIEIFTSFLKEIGFKYKSISKIDIALDIQQFDNRMNPQTLIRGIFSSKYWKVGQTKFSSYQKQSTSIEYSGIYFGAPTSPVRVRFYNKSQELEEVREKPYIRDQWKGCNMNENKPVWRLELSIKSDGRNMVKLSTGEIISMNIKDIDTKEKLFSMFCKYAKHYFKFRINDGKTKKKYAKDLELLKISEEDSFFKPIRLTASECSGRTEKLVIKKLWEISDREDLRGDEYKSIMESISTMSHVYRINIGKIREKMKKNN